MKRIILSVAVLFSASLMFGQGKYGADSAECIKYLSFYTQYMKQGSIDQAVPSWRKAISLCPPTASQHMLIDGMKIMRNEIKKNSGNPVRKKELVDTLMMLHQMRLDTYPSYRVPILTNRAMDMINYSEHGQEKEVYDALEEAMDAAQDKSNVTVAVRYMHYAIELYKNGVLTEEDVLNSFQKSVSVLESVDARKPSDMVKGAIADVENMFAQSGVASCEGLVKLFEPRYEANPEDKALLSNIVTLFSSTNCVDEILFRHAVEGLHKVDPSYNSAYLLYKLYAAYPEESQKAVDYMLEAIAYEGSDAITDAQYYFELSTYYCQMVGNNAEAVATAKKCAELSKDLAPKAYLLIGTIWGANQCKGNEIESRSNFWVAVDYMVKAKNLDPSLAEEANKHIATYSRYFPKQEEAFMYDIVDGDSYTVSCGGMRENTTVRTLKQ